MGFRRSKDNGLALNSRDTGLALNNKDITLHAEIEMDAQEELDSHLQSEVKMKPLRHLELDSPLKPEVKIKPQRPLEINSPLKPEVKTKPQRPLELDSPLKPEVVSTKPQRPSKSAKPESKAHDHKKAHRPIKSSTFEESEKAEPSRQSQPYQQSYAKAHPKSTSGPMFADIEAPDRLSDTATSAVTALILLCVFLVWGWRYQARQRTVRAEKEISVIIGEICAVAPNHYPNMLSYAVVTRESTMDSSLVSVLIGYDKLARQCFLRQTEPHNKLQRVEFLRAMCDEMMIKT